MNYEIKRLKHGTNIFVPQTVAEAVLIKENPDNSITTLDKVINKKVEIITSEGSSGLQIKRTGNSVDISHTNQVTPNTGMQPLQIQYDNNGHIIGAIPLGKFTINVNSEQLVEVNGTTDQSLNFGDDFQNNNNNITIRWNSYGTT